MKHPELQWAGPMPAGRSTQPPVYILRQHPDPHNPMIKRALAKVEWVEVLHLWRLFYRSDDPFFRWVPASTHAFLKDAQATAMTAALLTQ